LLRDWKENNKSNRRVYWLIIFLEVPKMIKYIFSIEYYVSIKNEKNAIINIINLFNFYGGLIMAGLKKRIVVLRNFDSDTIDQAILILKDGCTKDAKDGIVTEAEKIIDDYIYCEKHGKHFEKNKMLSEKRNTDSRWNPKANNKRDSISIPKTNSKKPNVKLDKYLNFFLAICCISILYLFFRLI
jgi:hypothetical protein